MRFFVALLLLFIGLAQQGVAQQFRLGLIPTPDAEYKAISKYEPTRSTEIIRKIVDGKEIYELKIVDGPLPNMPSAVDLTEFAPPVGTQSFGDCTAWATAYCCLSTQNAKARGRKQPTDSNSR